MKSRKIDKMPARLDFLQSATGLILGVFIMGHILFESSILISHEMMYKVTIMFEGYYFFGERYPGIISFFAASVFVIFILHAAVALKKFPNNYKQHKIMRNHITTFKHEDTHLWIVQIISGFIMLFVGSVHLYTMMAEPQNIGPFASAFRVLNENMAPLYFLLLLSVVSHAFIGLYRLALKWGFMEGKNTKTSRKRFKFLMRAFIVVYIIIGSLSLAKYIYIGYTNDLQTDTRYQSTTIDAKVH